MEMRIQADHDLVRHAEKRPRIKLDLLRDRRHRKRRQRRDIAILVWTVGMLSWAFWTVVSQAVLAFGAQTVIGASLMLLSGGLIWLLTRPNKTGMCGPELEASDELVERR